MKINKEIILTLSIVGIFSTYSFSQPKAIAEGQKQEQVVFADLEEEASARIAEIDRAIQHMKSQDPELPENFEREFQKGLNNLEGKKHQVENLLNTMKQADDRDYDALERQMESKLDELDEAAEYVEAYFKENI